jgi:hypothetical protein
MRMILKLSAAALAAVLLTAPPAQAKTCRDMVTAKARSAAQGTDEARQRRARDRAMSSWSRRARDTYGWAYRFWSRAAERNVQCGGSEGARHCTASAKPCRLL